MVIVIKMNKIGKYIILALALFLLSTCANKKDVLFTDLDQSETGIRFQNTLFEDGPLNVSNYIYFYNGGGVAVGDINNDGLPDILFTGNMVRNRLYLNKGNFQFEDITPQSTVDSKQGWCTGANFVDINEDGYLDIYICRLRCARICFLSIIKT
jgi:enediyne biosynthesis protein E4